MDGAATASLAGLLEALGDPGSGVGAGSAAALDRFFCRDQSYREIGDALAIPAGTIASRISRCLARLKEALRP